MPGAHSADLRERVVSAVNAGTSRRGASAVFKVSVSTVIRWGSIAPVTAGRHDCGERVEVEIDNGLKGLRGGGIAQAVGQRIVPGYILGLQRDQHTTTVSYRR
jgi:hypothetical protein